MSSMTSEETGHLARQAALRACWAQWVGMGSFASPVSSRRAEAIIDPEALILLSLYARDEERRLLDMAAWWAEAGSRLTSLQRLRAVAKRFPGNTGQVGLEIFASLAAKSGDRRWAKDAKAQIPEVVRHGKGPDEPTLIEASALWPRLRAAFGVGAKADTLVFLVGLRGAWASTKVISFATGYSSVTIRKAASEMSMARLIRETDERPVEYVAPAHPWAELLELYPAEQGKADTPGAPAFRFWSEIFAFLVSASEWSRLAESEGGQRQHVLASRARDVVERYALAFNSNGIPTPSMDAFRGLEAAQGLHETVRVVAGWVDENV